LGCRSKVYIVSYDIIYCIYPKIDIRHYCTGNPIFCYYFRLPQIEKEMKTLREIFREEILRPKPEIKVSSEEARIIKPKIVE